jgi:hypothetical protein
MRFLALGLSLLLGLAAGVAALAVCRSYAGLVLGVGSALVAMWTLRQWQPATVTLFAAGWLVPLLVAVAGRDEGDYVVGSDLLGWLLILAGVVILVLGLVWGRPPPGRRDSGSVGAAS